MNELNYFFGWPQGQVWPNLIAAVIWATPALFYTYYRIEKKHKQREDAMHNHIDQLSAKLTDEDIDN